MIRILKKLFAKIGIGILRIESLEELRSNSVELIDLKKSLELQSFLSKTSIPTALAQKALNELPRSMAQLQQDLFALITSNFKVGGYFVEFGATNGINLSNSFLLEKHYGWSGILAEPARSWHPTLIKNRNVIIETKCVWSCSGDFVLFNETEVGELSTVDSLSAKDMHSDLRRKGQKYEVETVSLEDLLICHNAPKYIDFLSIDTEGSEFEILNSFSFEKFTFGFICCEHNYTPNRDLVFNLLTNNGYIRVFSDFSKFDDWYVHSSLENRIRFDLSNSQ